MKTGNLMKKFVSILKRASEVERSFYRKEKTSITKAEELANDQKIYKAVAQLLEKRLRTLKPARLDIYAKPNAPRERVIDCPNGLWLIALSLQSLDVRASLTSSAISVIMAAKMTDGAAKFSDFECGAIYYDDGHLTQFIVLFEKEKAWFESGEEFLAGERVPEEDDVCEVDDAFREYKTVIFDALRTVDGNFCNHISGEMNSAEALFTYAFFKAVGGMAIDQEGHDVSQKIIGDKQWQRASVVAK